MAEAAARTRPDRPRFLVLVLSLALLSGLLAVVGPAQAFAAGTVLFQNGFRNRTVDGTGTVTKPALISGSANSACLSASGNSTTAPLTSCTTASDVQGSGKLRLTPATGNQLGGVYGATSFPTSSGLDVTFNTYQYGGGGADGMSFVLAAVDPTNPAPPKTIGQGGGSLGYAPFGGVSGLPNAYLGVGLDVYGNYSAPDWQGTGCTSKTNITSSVAGAVVVRGPGNGTVGYCGLSTSYAGTTASKVTLRATTRTASVVPVQVLINPGTTTFTSDTGQTVAAGTYKVIFTPVGTTTKNIQSGTLPTVPTSLYTSSSYLNASGYPKQLAFGFIGSTGGVTDYHEADDVKVVTFNAVAELAVTSTSYVAASPSAGDPVSYVVTPSVQSGVDVTKAITMVQTMPTGVTPQGAFGSGWTCAKPAGQTITCTTTATSFTNGTTLPPINVVGIVTGSGVTASTVQNGSISAVSSENANPASDTTTSAGTLPTAPSGVTLSPASGTTSGGGSVTLSGANLTGATAIEIGTSAEQQAGTPVVLLPCSAAITTACFTVSGSTLVVSSWPLRSAPAAVGVRVVTLGVQGAATYTYATRPATPTAPTATAGVTSATVAWSAPDANGSPLTGYVVTPYLGGVAQTPVSYDASATTRTLTGLTAGGSYTFTVAALNAYGTSTASPASSAVVPYTLPGAPTVSGVSAGDSSATLSWTAPASTGFTPVTGYVVTPYVGAVAQTPVTFTGTGTTQVVPGLTPGTAYTFRVAAVNAAGTGPASGASTAVTPNASPSLTFTAPPSGEVGVPYSRQLTVNDGTSPFTWSVSAGSLPAGLSLNATTGLLSGTPTTAGTSSFTVQVTDAGGQSATRAVTLVVAPRPAVTFSPASGEVGVAYSQTPTLSGGTAPFTWAVSAGSLPPGVSLSATTGTVAGTPTTAGTYSATVQVTDGFGQTAGRTVSIVVAAQPTLGIASSTVPQVGVAYSNSLPVTGGTAPFTWSVTSGSLPAGLSLDAGTGAVNGTPTTAGAFSATISVVDGFGQTASRAFAGTVTAGPLVVTKTANASSTVPGATVAYTITVANTGTSTTTGVALSDPLTGVLDDATYDGNAGASVGTLGYASGTLSWTGTLTAGSTATITYSVTVANPVTGNQVLTNTVSSSTLGTNCASGSTDTRCTATVTVSGLRITKTADSATTTPGSTVRFTVVATNSGRTAYVGATFTDNLAGVLDDAAYDGDARAGVGSLSYASPGLTWTGNLAVGASVTVTYTVTVADPGTGDRSLTGTVVSPTAGSVCPGGNPAASCTATVTVLVPALSITDAAAVATTTPGSTVAHTVTIANTGQTAYVATSVTVSLAGALDDAAYGGGAVADVGTVGYQTAGGTLTWTGDLAVGATATLTFSLTVDNPDGGDRTLTTVAGSAAPGSTCPAGGTRPACTSRVSVLVPALRITKTSDASSTTPGSVVRWTVLVANTGQTDLTGASVVDALDGVLDDATYGLDATATSGTVGFAGSRVSWVGDLAVGASATITYTATVRDPDTGNRSLDSTLTSPTPFSSCSPGCVSSVPVLLPGLTLAVASDVATTIPGGTVRYTLSATNTGQTRYAATTVAVDLSGVLDDATYGNDFSVSAGNLTLAAGGVVTWVLDLEPGARATATGTVTVRTPDPGDRNLAASIASDAAGSTCRSTTGGAACRSTVPVQRPGLTLTTTASTAAAQPGQPVTYTVTAVNDGESVQDAATFSDSLSSLLTDVTFDGNATASTGSVAYAGEVLTWSGRLGVGESATVRFTVVVRDPDPGDKLMVSTVVSPTPGSNCTTGSTDRRCTAVVDVVVPRLALVKSADQASTVPGGTVRYTLSIRNSGAVAYPAATATDTLTDVLDDAAYAGDADASSGSVVVTGDRLTWTGALAVGASATVTYSVTVAAADVGNDLLTNAVTSTTKGSTCAPGGSDPRCSVTVPVARLRLSQAYTETSTTPGSLVHLNATFTNTGQVPYSGITVASPSADTVDDANPNGDQRASSGTLSLGTSGISWTGSIAVGQTVTVTGTLTVRDPDTGNRLLTGTLVSSAPGSTCRPGDAVASCTARLPVLLPGLSITKTADTSAAVPGATVGWTVSVANTGETPYVGATVTDTLTGVLDDARYAGDATATSGTLGYTAPDLTWTGDLAVGATVVIRYSATVEPAGSRGDKNMLNVVSSADVGSTCPPGGTSAGCRSDVTVLTPGLTITAATDETQATLGSTVTATVTVTNSGQTDYPAATFSTSLAGVLDDATYVPPATATRGTVTTTDGALSWSGALAVGQSATVTYRVTVNNPASGDRSLVSTARSDVPGSNCAAGSTDSRCTTAVAVVNLTTITVTKTADAAFTTPGSTVGYTIKVANNAASGGALPASLTDPLGSVLDDATYAGDATATSGTVTVAEGVLTWSTDALAPGTSATIRFSVTVNQAITGDQVLTGTLTSAAGAASTNCPTGSTDGRCASSVPVARLVIQRNARETTATPGSVIHIPATYTNVGKVPYYGITVVHPRGDSADDVVPIGADTATSGTLVRTDDAIRWTGDIPVGGSVTVDIVRVVRDPDPGNHVITATITSTAPGNNCAAGSTDPRCSFWIPVLEPGLTVSKTADASFVTPGAAARFTVTVTNIGQTPYTAAAVTDNLVGVLDDGVYAGDAVATSGTVDYTAPNLTWTGDLAVGATATIAYTVTANRPATGDKGMVNTVSSTAAGSTCPPGSGNAACRSTVAVLTPGLSLAATTSQATALPGDTVTYTVVATNTGQTTYRAASFTAPLADLVDDAAVGTPTASRGTVTRTASALTWTGALAPGEAATVTFAATVADPTTGSSRLEQTLVSTNQGSTCPAAGATPSCTTSVPVAGLRITNRTDVATTQPRGVVTFTGVFTNTGQVPYYGITIDDSFVGTGDDAVYGNDATATAGSLVAVPGSGIISWTGDLPVGASVTVTGSVTVRDPDRADHRLVTVLSTAAPGSNCRVGATDPVCRTDVPVLEPRLDVRTVADASAVAAGRPVGYTLSITNTGQTAYAGAQVDQALAGILDEATWAGDLAATSGSAVLAGRTLRWTGDLALGQTATVTFSVTVDAPALGDKLLVSRATSDVVGSSCPSVGTAAAGCATTVRVLVPAFATSITADTTSTTPGGTVRYTVSLANTGETEADRAVVDVLLGGVLDDAVYGGDALASSGSVDVGPRGLTWQGDLPVGAAATVTFSATVNRPTTGDRNLVAALDTRVPGSTCADGAGAPGCTSTVAVLLPGLAVSTAADAATTTPGHAVRFVVTIANTGETAYASAAVTTALADVLDDAEVSGPPTASSGSVALVGTGVTWTGALPVGATATVTVAVVVDRKADLGDRRLTATATSDDPGSTCPGAGGDGPCTATVQVLVPSLTVRTAADTATTTPGGVVRYTTTLTNDGETAQNGVTVSTSLAGLLAEAAYDRDAVTTGGGVLAYEAPVLTWTGSLPVGASATVTFSVTVTSPVTGDRELSTSVTSGAPGSSCPPGTSAGGCSSVVQVLVPALQLTRTASTSTVVAGSAVRYTVMVVNTGQTPYAPATFRDDLAGVLDDAAYAEDATATSGSVDVSNSTLVWTGPLAVGASATVTYSVTTRFPALGDHVLRSTTVSPSAGSGCPVGTNRTRCRSELTVLVPALTVAKTASSTSVVAGARVGYTVTATNTGQADYAAAQLSDDLTGVLENARYDDDAAATGGSVGLIDGVLGWTGPLARGATVVITYSITVTESRVSGRSLVNTVVSPTVGSTCPVGAPGAACTTSTAVEDDVLTLSGLTDSFRLVGLPGDVVEEDGAVSLTVATNSLRGYTVAVTARGERLTASGTADTIPVDRLAVRPDGGDGRSFVPLAAGQSVQVHSQDRPSAPGGDAVSNDYRVDIPFVDAGDYGTTLEYIVTAQ